ncbi:MAG TPA: collagen-like protein [bacterium]|nr:collagen-like protein [bacterium]
MRQLSFVLLFTLLFLIGCQEGADTRDNAVQSVMVKQTAAATIDECPNGGVVLDFGFDKNGNGALDADEILKSEVVCHGVNGIDGQPGEKGATGAKGDTGAQGSQGDKGDTGDQGLPGVKGDKGDTGDQGLPGIDGLNGIHCWDLNGDGIGDTFEDINSDLEWNALDCIGPQGDTGAKGDKGDTGEKGEKGEKGDQGEPGLSATGGWGSAYGVGTALFAKNGDYAWSAVGPMQGMTIDTDKKVFTATEAGVYHITYHLSVLKPMGLKRWASVALLVNGVAQAASRRSVAGGGEITATVLLDLPAGATVSLRNVGASDLFPVDSPGETGDPGADAPSIVFIKLN